MGVADGVWARLAEGLGPPDALEHAGEARVGATLALVRDVGGDLEIVYTKRRDDLRTHPGQIALPGGRLDEGETVPEAALREAAEEVALDPSTATVLGALPAFYVPPSRYWLQAVVARWDRPHALVPAADEVAEIVRANVSDLCDPDRWRAVRLTVGGWSWAWALDGGHLLWGATGMATSGLLDRLAPGWHGGTTPADVAATREAQPWRGGNRYGRARAAWIPGTEALAAEAGLEPWQDPPAPGRLEAVALAGSEAVRRLDPRRVVVLVGAGGNGQAGVALARRLAADGRPVAVVADRPLAQLPADARAILDGLEALALPTELPRADLYVDALVGGGLRGLLDRGARRLLEALRRRDAPVLALDLPSGLDPERGLVGHCVAARVCLTLGGPRPGAVAPGVEPWVGDVYVADEHGRLARLLLPAGQPL